MKFSLTSLLLIIGLLSTVSLQAQDGIYVDAPLYKVVINHEEQYSILAAEHQNPKGWKNTGRKGSLAECQRYIEEVWTDMRPLSIRKLNLSPNTIYGVVINHEEQYSVWPKKKSAPQGWKFIGKSGDLEECMDYIEEVWTDMRPLSLRK